MVSQEKEDIQSDESTLAAEVPIPPPTKATTPDLEKQESPVPSITNQSDDQAPYSHFSGSEKRLIVFLIAFAGLFSPLSSFIYFPAITSLAQSLNVSVESINLTITSYMIIAGIAPAVIGNMADVTGRRFVYILTMGIYTAANIGLAVSNNWATLLVLRMVQSAGSAGRISTIFHHFHLFKRQIAMLIQREATIAIAYGVVSDIASPAERGSYVGAVLAG
jgi:MFS family permease